MDEFRFHMTLTGRPAPEIASTVAAALAPALAPLLPRPFSVTSVGLFGEDAEGGFHLVRTAPLTG